MAVTRRHYRTEDADRISDFLIRHYQPGNADGNWLQPTWEYALTHPYLDTHSLGAMTVWEDGDEIVGFCHYEHRLGEAFFELHPVYNHLKPAMLDCAEVNLRAANDQGHVYLKVFANDFDHEFGAMLASRGYHHVPEWDRPMTEYAISGAVEVPPLPDGYRLQTLAEDNDLEKWDRLLWRGFNHPGDPPPEGPAEKKNMQSGPNYRRDLAMVVVAPDGGFVSFCGMWFVPQHGYAYVEPVATDPDHRRKGLGRVAVLGGIAKCAREGAKVAYVGSELPFYTSIGFRRRHVANCFLKRFER
jgi:GNAT superfamily N-acetyltransferase